MKQDQKLNIKPPIVKDNDLWGLGESSLLLMDNEIENLLKEPTDERRSHIIESGQDGL